MLDPICEVNVRASGIIGLVYSMLNRLDNHLTGVNANPDLNVWISQARNLILHGQGRKACANRVIFMGAWGTKESHDAVALRFVDDPLITRDGLIHQVQCWLQALHPKL